MTDQQNGQQMEEFRIPDFIVTLVGQLQVQNAALQAQVQMLTQKLERADCFLDTEFGPEMVKK
jgi:hypothetical protein